jgi:hypothetical protein
VKKRITNTDGSIVVEDMGEYYRITYSGMEKTTMDKSEFKTVEECLAWLERRTEVQS